LHWGGAGQARGAFFSVISSALKYTNQIRLYINVNNLKKSMLYLVTGSPLSVAWLPLAGFWLPPSPLPQVALAAVGRAVVGGY
jgi:hypothetical protein